MSLRSASTLGPFVDDGQFSTGRTGVVGGRHDGEVSDDEGTDMDDECRCWMCLRPGTTREDYLDHIRESVDRHGWVVQAVAGTRVRAPFAYTVGLTERGLPELVVTGRREQAAGELLNHVAAHTVHDGWSMRPGEVVQLGELELEVVDVPHPEAHLFTADALYGPALRAVQLVWADDRGRLPWELGHRAGRGGQPVLGPRTVHPRTA